jgi:hypothetical protein
MKKVLAILVVLALCVPAMAATVDIAIDGDEATITVTAAANIVGLALDIDIADGDVTSATVDTATFNIFMDAAHDLEATTGYNYGDGTAIANQDIVGELALPAQNIAISVGALNGAATPGADGSAVVVITVVADGASITVSENNLRGGIILADGTGEDIDGGSVSADFEGGEVVCVGDITEDYLSGTALINGLDLSALVVYLTPHAPGYAVSPIPAGDEKYDVSGDGTTINGLDLTPHAPGYATSDCIN